MSFVVRTKEDGVAKGSSWLKETQEEVDSLLADVAAALPYGGYTGITTETDKVTASKDGVTFTFEKENV